MTSFESDKPTLYNLRNVKTPLRPPAAAGFLLLRLEFPVGHLPLNFKVSNRPLAHM